MAWPAYDIDRLVRERPAIRVNQLGYLPGQPWHATLVSRADEPLPFVLRGPDGAEVFTGHTDPWPVRPEPTSGLSVHRLDFTAARPVATGGGFWLEAQKYTSHPFAITDDLYDDLARDALQVFRLLRSGYAVEDPTYGRPAGHLGVPPNTGDLAVPAWDGPDAERLYPGWVDDRRYDVSGGWYDAGDYGKYVTSGSIACWQLLSTVDLLGGPGHPGSAGLLAECRWQLDWLLRMQLPSPHPLAGLAFHRVHGTEWSPLSGLPHEDPTRRVLHRPSTIAALQLAGVAAYGARVFATVDARYSVRLLTSARTAYAAAERHPDLLPPNDHALFGGGPYDDQDAADDACWAVAELWLATGEERYRQLATAAAAAAQLEEPARSAVDGFDFDALVVPAQLDLARHGSGELRERALASVLAVADALLRVQQEQPWGQPYAPADGWDWGSNGRLLNNLVVLGTAQQLTGDDRYRAAVATGMDHLLGRNALGQSYVTGYGTDDSQHQRTRAFGHDHDPRLPPTPAGALAGGANSRPAPDFPYDPRLRGRPSQLCYLDEPTSEVTNDICIRWNAPLVWVATYLNTTAELGS